MFAELDGTGTYVAGGETSLASSRAMPAPTGTPSGSVTVAAGAHLLDRAVQIVTAGTGATGGRDPQRVYRGAMENGEHRA